jgi:hypothetical protein
LQSDDGHHASKRRQREPQQQIGGVEKRHTSYPDDSAGRQRPPAIAPK